MNDMDQNDRVISVIVVDDHQMLTDALALILRGELDMKIVAVAGSFAEGHALLKTTCPDVLLLDISLPDGNGLDLAPHVKEWCPATNIVILTALSDEKTLMRAIDTGVAGFFSKNRPLADVISAIRRAAEGEIIMPASLLMGLLGKARRSRTDVTAEYGIKPLTPRELEILALLARGRSGAAIAAELNIAPLTVRTHIRNLIDKLGVHSRLEAVAWALRHGLIDPPS